MPRKRSTKSAPKKGGRKCKPPAGPKPRRSSRPDWRPPFLAALAQTGNITEACRVASIDRGTFYHARDTDTAFAEAVRAAFKSAADALELEARRRAHDGYDEPVVYKGELAGVWVDAQGQVVEQGTAGATLRPLTIRKYSDTLLIFLMKGANPKKYRERFEVKHKGKLRHQMDAENLTDDELARIAGGAPGNAATGR